MGNFLHGYEGLVNLTLRLSATSGSSSVPPSLCLVSTLHSQLSPCNTASPPFSAQRIAAVRRMIAAAELGSPARDEALLELKEYQKEDFEGIFR